jgi:hypothetical protein
MAAKRALTQSWISRLLKSLGSDFPCYTSKTQRSKASRGRALLDLPFMVRKTWK